MKKKILFALTISLNLIMAVVVVFIGLNAAKNPGEESVEHENGIKLATTATPTSEIVDDGDFTGKKAVFDGTVASSGIKESRELVESFAVDYVVSYRVNGLKAGFLYELAFNNPIMGDFDIYAIQSGSLFLEDESNSYTKKTRVFKNLDYSSISQFNSHEKIYLMEDSDIVFLFSQDEDAIQVTDGNFEINRYKIVDIVVPTQSDIDAYIADKKAPDQKYFLYDVFNIAGQGATSVVTAEVYPTDVNDCDGFPDTITFLENHLYILEGVSNGFDYEEAYLWFKCYNTNAGEISAKCHYYNVVGCDFDCYYDEDNYANDIERQIASCWKTNVSKLVNQCHSSPGTINWCSLGANIVFIPSEDITITWNQSQTLKYPSTNLYMLESDLLGWVPPVVDLQAPVVNIPATYVVNVDNMESLDNILTQHVKITDETDPNPQLIVRSSSYDSNSRVCGTYPITIYAQDAAGNTSADLTFNVLVADATSPSISIKTGVTVGNNLPEVMSDSELIQELFEISDNYDSFSNLRIDLNRSSYNASNYHVAGTKEVSVEVYDQAGNFADAFATLTVFDAIAPTITAANKEISNDNFGFIYEHNLPLLFTVSDDTSAADKITKTIVENTYSENWNKPGTYQVTCEAKDEARNTNRATSTITVYDAIPPEVSVTAITISYTHKLTDEEILAHVTATDREGTPTITLDRAAYDENYAKVGSYKINVNVSDGRNVVTKELPITVFDDVKPVIVGPSVVQVGNSTKLTIEELKSKFTVTDAIDGAINFTMEDLNGYADSYTKVNEYDFKITATDAAGNTNTFTLTLEVTDNTSPNILYDQYFIVLQEGEVLTDEMIKAYASKVFNVSLESIVSIEGDYNVEEAGTYSLMVALEDGTKQSLTVSVSDKPKDPSEGEDSTKQEAKFELKHFFSADISNWTAFDAWPAWSICVWLIWVAIGIVALIVSLVVLRFGLPMIFKLMKRLIKG